MINILIIVVLALLTGFNIYYLFYLKSRGTRENKDLEIDNYYKLDAKIELQKYLAIGLISIATIFGYTRFTDLSDKFQEFETIDKKYKELNSEYDRLIEDNKDLNSDLKEFRQMLHQIQLDKNKIEIEFIKQNQKIKEATRQIPEANIRILTKQLIETNLRDAGTSGIWIDNPDTILIKKELVNSKEMLKSAGYSADEIDNFIKEIQKKYKWIK